MKIEVKYVTTGEYFIEVFDPMRKPDPLAYDDEDRSDYYREEE